jgi:bifunctional non-homologous end joining protein LigD
MVNTTTVNVYSLRAKPQPSVSTPVTWQEVESSVNEGAAPFEFTSDAAFKRVEKQGDLSAPLLTLKQRLLSLR